MFGKPGVWRLLLICTALAWQPAPANAEGSRELNTGSTNRAYLEFSTAVTAAITRQAVISVYVEAGETVNLGSSVRTNTVVPNQDIIYRSPLGGQTGSCDVSAATGFGLIDTVARENAGPQASAGANPNGYIPCTFVASETGIYEVIFHRPNNVGNPSVRLTTDNAAFLDANQAQAVAGWDITIRNGTNTLGTERPGRAFTRFLPLNVGGNGASISPTVFIQTRDGYRYRASLNNLDPFGFILIANSRGYIDQTNNSTLYRTITGPANLVGAFDGNVIVQRPDVPDTATNITHFLFFNRPDPLTLMALGIPLAATPPPVPSNLQFTGNVNSNQTLVGAGGTFTFNSPTAGSYELIIDTNNDGIFNPQVDRLLQNPVLAGSNSVVWDGRDAAGVNLPPRPNNAPYIAQVRIRVGEYHFPLIDVENNPGSGLTIELENAPVPFPPDLDTNNQPINRFTVYYNNSNYTTANGTAINLAGAGAPTPTVATRGISSQNGILSFTNNWGNEKGKDIWAYLPGATASAPLVILPPQTPIVLTVKRITRVNATDINTIVDDPNDPSDNNPFWPANYLRGAITQTLRPNDVVEYTIYFLNGGQSPALSVRICDRLDPQLEFVPNSFNANSPADGGLPADRGIALAIGSTTPSFFLTNINDPPDRGQFVNAPTVPTNCNTIDNPNSTVIANVTRTTGSPPLPQIPNATGAGTPVNSYGFVRFRARVR